MKDRRILIIDDDVNLLDSFKRWMRREVQFEVHCATDREEAEALLDCYDYALVLTDLSLSPQRLEGLDLIDRVRSVPVKPKLITLSGNGTREIKSLALHKGADVFLDKPTPIGEIIATMHKLIESRGVDDGVDVPAQGKLLTNLSDSYAIQPYFQPIFRVTGTERALVAVECLSRGPAGTPFEPASALFAYARRKRVEAVIDQKCISLALGAARTIPDDIWISVNVHASTLGRLTDFPEWLCTCASINSIELHRLTVEIVEHSPIWNKEEFLRTLDRLRDAGIRIALDDIGLGHSNYQMIVDARPDYFKIDRYFVDGCSRDKYRRAVVASIAKLAAELDSRVVAEGVDSQEDLEQLQTIGVTLMQSFFFCRPIRASEFNAQRCVAAH